MSEPVRRRVSVEVPWRTLFKLIVAVALVWVWLQLTQLILLVIVAILLAVTLDPVVRRVERRGLPRWGAATLVSFVLLGLVVLFLWFTWSSLADQSQYLAQHFTTMEHQLVHRLPGWARNIAGGDTDEINSRIGTYALRLARSAASAAVVFVIAFILTLYLLIEGKRTRDWVMA